MPRKSGKPHHTYPQATTSAGRSLPRRLRFLAPVGYGEANVHPPVPCSFWRARMLPGKERGIGLKVVLQGIDTTIGGPVDALTMNLLAAFAQFATEIRRERQMDGIARAKAAGAYKGRKPSVSAEAIHELQRGSLGPSAIARKLGCGRTTVYRLHEGRNGDHGGQGNGCVLLRLGRGA